MFTDDFTAYLIFQMILLYVNVLGYFKIKILSYMAIITSLLIAPLTVLAFDTYWMMGVMLVIMNMSIPIFAIVEKRK